ncbi:MAG TPA: putative Ig domain-containing protein [Candidatus Acidoferrum sp.]|nr:putative Ig domain-containing protein [Candidatus Acidoferrum sp.]
MRHTTKSHEPEHGRPPATAGLNRLASVGGQILLALLLLTKSLAAAPLTITTGTLSNAVVGTAYSQTLAATGGTPPYTWTLQAGGLPSLLTLNPTNGQIAGMPMASGSWVFSYPFSAYIVVTDAAANAAAADFVITVVPAPNTYFTLTVSNGSGGGLYLTNTTVGITANAAPAGEVFDNWTGAAVANPLAASTSLVMPASNVTVTAVYGAAPPSYPLTVVNGTGGGSFPANTSVPITANAAPTGQVFVNWTGAVVANPQSSNTTLIMPAAPTTVTANDGQPAPTYALVVVNGSGSGNFTANTTVSITADAAPAGEVFGTWSGAIVANPTATNTTLVMPSNDVTVTANYGFAPPAVTNVPQPVTGHPRLWITPADLPRLQSWAVATNPIYEEGLVPLLRQCVSDYQSQFFPGGSPNAVYPDLGDSQGYTGLLSEQYMMVFALNALIDPNPAARIQYAQYAHDLMMYAMNQAAQGPLANAPFRDPTFPIYNRASFSSESWPLTLDWLYNATNASGQFIFTAQDKATIRKAFLIWASECLTASTTGGDSPQPVGAMNNPVLLPGGKAYRMAANNYYQAHARLLTLMSLCMDPADDPSLDSNAPPALLGNSLRSYILDATGAWLYQQFAMFGDADVVASAYGLGPTASVGLASGGLPPEGMLYGDSVRSIAGELLALKTAGFADPAISGPQVALANNAPVWSRFVPGFISSLVPAQQIPPEESYLGLVYEFASYGDILRMYATPDMVSVFGVLSLLDRQNNDDSRLNAERWFAINAVEGGAPTLLSRVQDPWTWGVQDSIFLFLLLDPSATTTDPRPNYATAFYDPGQGRLVDRTDWSSNATLFDFRCSWESINHQQGDANQFEFYRHGEWLTKGVANYDNNDNGQSSDYHNTLTLQNRCANGTPGGLGWEITFWTNGSQWPLAINNGDPTTYASVQTNYDYAYGDATQLYNRPEVWIPADAALDLLHASRSIIWLKPDHIVVYDRAISHTAGLFKQFNLSFPTLPTINGNLVTTTTPGGQHLYLTSLLPAGATLTPISINGALTTVADLEPCQYRMVIQDTNNPTNERFLHVLQGADAGVQADDATLIQSTAGTPMEGAVVGKAVVLFMVDATTPFNGTTYTVPASVNQHFITGCAPNGFYNVTGANTANGLAVSVAPSASGAQADAAGVLAMGALTVTGPWLNFVASPSNLTLSWPTNAAGFVLNQTSSLAAPTTWTPVTSGISVNGTNYTITINTGSGVRFYALIPP